MSPKLIWKNLQSSTVCVQIDYLLCPVDIDAITPSQNAAIMYSLIVSVNLYSSIPKVPQKLVHAGVNTNFVLLRVMKHIRITLIGNCFLPN